MPEILLKCFCAVCLGFFSLLLSVCFCVFSLFWHGCDIDITAESKCVLGHSPIQGCDANATRQLVIAY